MDLDTTHALYIITPIPTIKYSVHFITVFRGDEVGEIIIMTEMCNRTAATSVIRSSCLYNITWYILPRYR